MWSELNTVVSTICTAVVLFGLLVGLPLAKRLLSHLEVTHLRRQKAEALLRGHDPSRLDPDYLEHLQTMRLRDLQTVALEHGYDPLKLDPDYEFEEKNSGDEEAMPAQPHDELLYVQGYQGQMGRD